MSNVTEIHLTQPSMREKLPAILFLILFYAFLVAFILSLKYLAPRGYNLYEPERHIILTENFSEDRFLQIETGMTNQQVASLLGEPFLKMDQSIGLEDVVPTNAEEIWHYSKGAHRAWDEYTWLGYEVDFDNQGKVIGTRTPVHFN